jgi:stress-induced morphogen
MTPDEIRSRIEAALPGARVAVRTFSGEDHFEATVEAVQFEGKSRVEQHQMVYAAVRDALGGEIHALALRTRAPGEPTGAGQRREESV